MRLALRLMMATTVLMFAAGCGGSGAGSPTATPPPATPSAASPAATLQGSNHAIDITLSGALVEHLVSRPVSCALGVGNSGQPLLRLDMTGIAGNSSTGPSLGIDIVDYQSTGTYSASAVWTGDGATSVTIDSDLSQPVIAERFVATSGNVMVTSVGETSDTGTVSATLVPETPRSTADVVHVNGYWSCVRS